MLSQDGKYIYMVTEFWPANPLNPPIQVIRVRTSDFTIDQTVPLADTASGIAVSPVDSGTWSAAFSPQPDVYAVEIFDGAVARPNNWSIASDAIYGNEGVWSPDGATMYILDANLNAVTVTPTGLGSGTLLQSGNTGFDTGGNIQLAGGLLYSNGGEVLDPQTNTIVGQYVLPSGVPYAQLTIDPANNRVFASYVATTNGFAQGTIQSFDLSTFSPMWIARLPVNSQPLRWGTNGLAWICASATTPGEYDLCIINGSFVAP